MRAEHDVICRSLVGRDSAGAEAAMRAHIEKSYQRLVPYAKA